MRMKEMRRRMGAGGQGHVSFFILALFYYCCLVDRREDIP